LIVLIALAGCSKPSLREELKAATRSAARGDTNAYLRHFVSPEQIGSLVDCSGAIFPHLSPETRRTELEGVRRSLDAIMSARITFDDIFEYGPPEAHRAGEELSGCRVRRTFTVQGYSVTAKLRFPTVTIRANVAPDRANVAPVDREETTTNRVDVWRFDGGTHLWTDPFEHFQ